MCQMRELKICAFCGFPEVNMYRWTSKDVYMYAHITHDILKKSYSETKADQYEMFKESELSEIIGLEFVFQVYI